MIRKLIIGFIFLIIPFLLKSDNVFAQGACTCIVSAARTCGLQSNSCDSGYTPTCTSTITQCNATAQSCSCVSTGSVAGCGGTSEVCCAGNTCNDNTLTCHPTAAGNRCLNQTQIGQLQGQLPSSSTQPSSPLGGGSCGTGSLDTALGCIPLDETGMITFILTWAIGVGGGVAFLLIIYSTFMIMTSQGDPKRLQAGQELLSSAIMGLILLIFSVTLLRIIGVQLFNIPNF